MRQAQLWPPICEVDPGNKADARMRAARECPRTCSCQQRQQLRHVWAEAQAVVASRDNSKVGSCSWINIAHSSGLAHQPTHNLELSDGQILALHAAHWGSPHPTKSNVDDLPETAEKAGEVLGQTAISPSSPHTSGCHARRHAVAA